MRASGSSVGDERASLDGGTVVGGVIEDAEAVVTGTPAELYALVVLGDLETVAIEGDVSAVERLAAALASSALVARPVA